MRPFGRTFWICLAAAAILAIVGIIVAFRVPGDLRPRHPGQPAASAAPPPPPLVMCSDTAVADLTSEANHLFTSGEAASALRGIRRAITCKPDDAQLYRLAATFACAAHDGEAADFYIRKVPEAFRPALRQLCQQANVPLAH